MDLRTRFSEHEWTYIVDSSDEDVLPELDLDGLLAEAVEDETLELLELEDALEAEGSPPIPSGARRPPQRGSGAEPGLEFRLACPL